MHTQFRLYLMVICLTIVYELQECKEIHEAFFSGDCKKAPSFCKHKCVNIDKGFICRCNDGYQLETDGQSCKKKVTNAEIGSSTFVSSSHQQSNSLHHDTNQLTYSNKEQTDRHNVELGQTGNNPDHVVIDHQTNAIDNNHVVLGSGGMLPPMAIMRPPTCDNVVCRNGGHCVIQQSVAKCACGLGFGGRFCEQNIPVKYPKFSGDGYQAFPELTDSSKQFDMTIVFRPESSGGLILFSGDKKDASSDFLSVALTNGYIQFRFDCGTGQAVLESKGKVSIGEWNTVHVSRINNEGILQLNNEEGVAGYSQGAYSMLTLHLKLYLGGYIDMDSISPRVGVSEGFSGCIQSLKVNDKQYDMRPVDNYGQAELGQNVGECSSKECLNVACQNGGRCTSTGADQHVCLCPLGWTGDLCQKGEEIHVPHFSGHSFLRHTGLERSSLSYTEIEMIFKPSSWEGLMLYNGYTNDKKGDFISLAMREGHVEFQFDLGTGPGVLRSIKKVELNRWHHVRVMRTGLQGVLEVNDQMKVEGISGGGFTQLTLLQDLYIGGHDNFDHISQVANLSSSFQGCIQKIIINGHLLRLVADAREGINVANCDHTCVDQPCMNAGECEPDKEHYTCYCPLGFTGSQCEQATDGHIFVPHFSNHGYLMFTEKQILDRITGYKIDLQFKIRPESPNGLIFWASKDYPLQSTSDFMAVGFINGALVFQYDLGSGEAKVVYNSTNLFDGQWHSIHIQRSKQIGYIMVDNTRVEEGNSLGSYTVLNTNQILYIGGLPHISRNTMKKFSSGYGGCLKDIMLAEDYEFDLVAKSKEGRNIDSCPYS